MSEIVTGEIRLFAGTVIPEGWFSCDGRILTIDDYAALFSLIGTAYGGDGRTTFAVPNLNGRVAVGVSQASGEPYYAIGTSGGTTTVQLKIDEMPKHRHGLNVTNTAATAATPGPTLGFGNVAATQSFYIDTTKPTNGSIEFSDKAVSLTGSGVPHDNLMPWLGLRYMICHSGIYPDIS